MRNGQPTAVSRSAIRALRPYLVGEAYEDGEWQMHCPLHEDSEPSASLSVTNGTYYCFACGSGGTVGLLIDSREEWTPPSRSETKTNGRGSARRGREDIPSSEKVSGWCKALLSDVDGKLTTFIDRRGLTEETIKRRLLGWDMYRRCYTIPIYNGDGLLINVRRYRPDAEGRRKMRSLTGHGDSVLYPLDQLEGDELVIAEGELDALLTIQSGFPAITHTNGAKRWTDSWSPLFSGKTVYLAHDCDTEGQNGNLKVGRKLADAGAFAYILRLPYAIEPKHGKDLTDFFLTHDPSEFQSLLDEALPFGDPKTDPISIDMRSGRLSDAFQAAHVGEPIRFSGTVIGRGGRSYVSPEVIEIECEPDDEGDFCDRCPVAANRGRGSFELPTDDPVILQLLDINHSTRDKIVRSKVGAPSKCAQCKLDVVRSRDVSGLVVRSSIEAADETATEDMRTERVVLIGDADYQPGSILQFEGALHPSPQSQAKEFMAWGGYPQETSLDRFEPSPEALATLARFRPEQGQRSLAKAVEIARDLEAVTRIYGRVEMHLAMLLTFYSAVAFIYQGDLIKRGWIEALIIGDFRTGKSKAAERLASHIRLGSSAIIAGDSASFAGLFGGVRESAGKGWEIAYGSFPINDRRAVIIDEVSGMSIGEISKMTAARSEGRVRIAKIEAGDAFARVRSLWLSNPRGTSTLSTYVYGCDAIKPLIGQPEDIARFTFAMSVINDERSKEAITHPPAEREPVYDSEAMQVLKDWAWSRKTSDIIFSDDVHETLSIAVEYLDDEYRPEPPLMQTAEAKEKVLRVAIALAQLTFSTDEMAERVIVRGEHVDDAVAFLDRIYSDPAFAYRQRCERAIEDERRAAENAEDIRGWLKENPNIVDFLRDQGARPFTTAAMMSVTEADSYLANTYSARLAGSGMVRITRDGAFILPPLATLIRNLDLEQHAK